MNILTILPLASAGVSFFLGTFIFAKKTESSENILFMLFCMAYSSVCFAEFSMRIAVSYEEAYFWMKLTVLFPLAISFLFHFSLVLTEKIKRKFNKILVILVYVSSIVIMYLDFTTTIILIGPQLKTWGWTYLYNEDTLFLSIYLGWLILITITAVLVCFRYYLNIDDVRKKLQLKYITLGISITVIIYLIIDLILAILYKNDFPEMGTSSFVLCSAFIGYSIWKYKLFKLDLVVVAENIAKNLSDIVILTNLNHRIKAVNKIAIDLFEYEEAELIDMPVADIFTEKDQKIKHYEEKLFNSLEVIDGRSAIETEVFSKTGKKVPISLAISLFRDDKGKIQGILYIGRDITVQRKYIDEILKNTQFQMKFVSLISHELRTPLNAIIGFSDLLLEKSYGELTDQQSDFLNDIKSSSEHLLKLINNILDISKVESGEINLEFEDVQLKSLIDEVRIIITPLYTKKGLTFDVIGVNSSLFVYADPLRLKEIILNLISNAIKFTHEGSVIFKVENRKEFWEFSVIDTGIGIDKKDHDLIFKEFKRVKSIDVMNIGGTGLGLALSKRLVTLHGGDIFFKSKLGEGSSFIFTIPKKETGS